MAEGKKEEGEKNLLQFLGKNEVETDALETVL